MQPISLHQLTPKTRVCARWSVKFSCFYPGTIQGDDNEDEEEDDEEEKKEKEQKKKEEQKEKKPRGRKPKIKIIDDKNKNTIDVKVTNSDHNNKNEIDKNETNKSEINKNEIAKTDFENISEASSGSKCKGKHNKKELRDVYVNIDFDDEDSGKFPIDFIRLLPKDFPLQKGVCVCGCLEVGKLILFYQFVFKNVKIILFLINNNFNC